MASSLSPEQRANATLIYRTARKHGLPHNRAIELVKAAYNESGLLAHNTNKSSGAAGLFQLLSPGYRQRAQKLGGLYNPRANTLAILPDYLSYWRKHPNARPGEAGRDVERSGMGADFYARGPNFAFLAGGAQNFTRPRAQRQVVRTRVPDKAALNRAKIEYLTAYETFSHGGDIQTFLGAAQGLRGALKAAESTPLLAQRRKRQPDLGYRGIAGSPYELIGVPYQGTHTLGNWESDRAVDLRMPVGTPLYAAFDGTIGQQFGSLGKSGRFAGTRLHLVGKGDELYYAHLQSAVVKPGEHVHKGQLLGYSGEANGVPHLHLGARNRDPRVYLTRRRRRRH